MKTKTLLIAAAALAATVISSQAQVYSGIVGYQSITLTNGFNLVANQLDLDGNLTNNTLNTCIGTNMPNGTQVYAFNPTLGSYSISTFSAGLLKWTGATNAANAALSPGQGVFVKIPAAASYPQTFTEVGNVIQGTNVIPIQAGFQIVSSIPTISGSVQTNFNYVPTHSDQVYIYNAVSGGYSIRTFNSGTTWVGGQPILGLGQAVFLKAIGPTNWTQSFVAQ
jgi:hypothetical protein